MQLLADENIPLQSIRFLRNHGLDIAAISEMSPRIPDEKVLEIAEKQGRTILTFDLDFGELVIKRNLAASSGIVLFRFIPQSPLEVGELFLSILASGKIKFNNRITVVERDYIRQRPIG